jgi:hypothetical protein
MKPKRYRDGTITSEFVKKKENDKHTNLSVNETKTQIEFLQMGLQKK